MKLKEILKEAQSDPKREFHDMDVNEEWKKFRKAVNLKTGSPVSTVRSLGLKIAIAASILLLAGIAVYFIRSNGQIKTIEIANQQNNLEERRDLPDGTSVILSPNSILSHNITFNNRARHIDLVKGAIDINVAHMDHRPFTVQADGLEITDIGTKFKVTLSDSGVIIHTSEGLVSAKDLQTGITTTITQSETKFFNKSIRKFIDQTKMLNTLHLISPPSPKKNRDSLSKEQVDPNIRVYYAGYLIKFLQKQYSRKLKVIRRAKYDKQAKVSVNLTSDLPTIISAITSQTNIKSRPGKCPECIELYTDKK